MTFDSHLADARRSLAHSLTLVQRCLPRANTVRNLDPGGGVPACTNCQPVTYAPQRDDAPGLCDWCYRFRLAHSELPDHPLVILHHEGKRMTSQHMREFSARSDARARSKAHRQAKRRKAKR